MHGQAKGVGGHLDELAHLQAMQVAQEHRELADGEGYDERRLLKHGGRAPHTRLAVHADDTHSVVIVLVDGALQGV